MNTTDQTGNNDYVEIGGPVGDFEILPSNDICLGDSIQLIVTSTYATTISADFRDGTVETLFPSGDSL